MPSIKVKRSDLDKFRPVDEPGWKIVECLDVADGVPASSGESTNYWTKFKIVGPDGPDKGLEFDHCCNDSGDFAVEPLICAANNITREELFGGQDEANLDLDSLVGKTLEANVGHRTDKNNRVNNNVEEWAPLGIHFPDAAASGGTEAEY